MTPLHVSSLRSVSIHGNAQSLQLKDGAIVRVEVLAAGSAPSGKNHSALIRIGGHIIEAASAAGCRPGEVFTALVHRSARSLLLTPVLDEQSNDQSICAKLSLPETPELKQVIEYMTQSSVKLDPAVVLKVSADAQRAVEQRDNLRDRRAKVSLGPSSPSPRMKNVLFASWLLHDASIEAEPELIEYIVQGLEGYTGHAELIAYLNHSKGAARHWLIIPYARSVQNEEMKGSIRILIDLDTGKALRTELWCEFGGRIWEFYLESGEFSYLSVPGFSPVTFTKFGVYLQELLKSSGLEAVFRTDQEADSSTASIDVRL